MRVGLILPPHVDLARVVPLARRVEELGYDVLASGEHVFFHAPTPNAFVALAAAAGATERIRLLSAVTVLPQYPAALAAKMAATLDGVSGGRFELGVGVGGEFPAEMRACGTDPSERGARADEALEILTRLLAGERVEYHGRFAELDGLQLDPVPPRRPPIWVGGRREASTRRAGRYGDVWMPYMVEPRHVAEGLRRARVEATERGRGPDEVRGAMFCWGLAAADGAWARRSAADVLARTYAQDFEPLLDRYVPAGTPESVASRLTEYGEAGVQTVLFAPACDDAHLERAVETFAREVAPALSGT